MKRLLLLALSTTLFSYANAQSIDTANVPVWADMMQDPQANFFETQRAFEKYWEGRERSRGDGWKVFKRWEWFWSQRINADGSFPNPDKTIDQYTSWRIAYNQSQQGAESLTGDWVEVGPRPKPNNGTGQPNGNGRLNGIAFHPTDTNTLYVGSPSGGFWRTTNGGASWETTTDNLPTLGVSAILVDTTNPSIIYIGTGDRDAGDAPGLGVYKSTDGGDTWTASSSGMGNKTVGQMLMHPTNANYILAATSGGIYRSMNAGATWTLESNNNNFKDMKFKPGDPNIVYATETSGGANFWRSTDAGDSWTQISSGLPSSAQRYSIAVSPADPSVVYLLRSQSSAYGGLFRSNDSGLNFNTQSTTPNILQWSENPGPTGGGGQGWYDLAVAADPTNEDIVYVGGVNIFKSTDAGVNWDCAAHWVGSATAASVHADHHWLEYSPYDGKLYNCNDGGLYYTADGGTTWPEISDSLGISQIYRIGVSANTNALVINGYQDNGTAIWDDNLFRTERGGDGMECVIDPTNDDIIYATVYYGNIARSTNNGVNFGSFAANNVNGITESGAWITPFIVDESDPQIMYIGYKNVWRTSDAYSANPTFTPISSNLAGSNSSNMRRVKLSKVNNNRLFALRSDNKLFRTDNAQAANPSWADLTSNLPSGWYIPDIETSPFDNNTLWLIRNNVVYESNNGGISWTNITGNLPNINKNCIVADPYSAGGLYVGTDAGVYYIDNNLTNWVAFDDGLPVSAEVTELEIFHPDGNWEASRIRAATYGRGLWESDLYDPLTNAPLPFIELSLSATDICLPDTISMISNVAYGVDSLHWSISPSAGVSFVNGTTDTSAIAQVVFSQVGSYAVTLYAENANGFDSITQTNAVVVSGGVSLPLAEDFEAYSPCSTSGCNSSCATLDWKNASDDDVDWRTDFGGTPSSGTGPGVDYDPGTNAGNYMYLESSGCLNQIGNLESPCLDLNNVTVPELKFAFHREGNASLFNALDVDVLSNGSWMNLWSYSPTTNGWQVDSVNLSNYVGQSVKVRFSGTTGTGWQSDMAIDGIEMTAGPSADFSANDTLPCIGQTVFLQDQSSQNPTSWTWSISPNTFSYINSTNASSQYPQVTFSASGTYTVTLQCANAYGSNSTTKTTFIEVVQPSPNATSNGIDFSFCDEDTAVVHAQAGMLGYKFYLNGPLAQQGFLDSFIINQPASGDELIVEVTDSNGCIGRDTLILGVFAAPVTDLVSDRENDELCAGDTVQFTNTDIGIENHAFVRQGTVVQDDTLNYWTSANINDEDSVYVNVIDSNGCIGRSNALYMTVNLLPPTPIISILLDSLNCSLAAEMYRWKFDDSTSINTNQTVPKHGDGAYSVRIFDGSCWSLWSEPLIITGFSGLNDFSMKVFPSPARNTLNLELLNLPSPNEGQIRIYDMNGKLQSSEDNVQLNNNETIQLDISKLATGAYTILLETGEKRVALSFVKEMR